MALSGQKNILQSDHVYEIGSDNPLGYYLFSNKIESAEGVVSYNTAEAKFNIYETYPPVSSYRREKGFFGLAQVSLGQKYILIENGIALYYGEQPLNLYEILSSANLPDGNFHSSGVIVLFNEVCTLEVYKKDKRNYFYHGDTDAVISEQYLYSINGHNYWAGFFDVETYRGYNSVKFGLKDLSKGNQYKLGNMRLRVRGINSIVCSIEHDPLVLYKGAGKDFFAIEIPNQVSMESVDIEWVQPSFSTKKLYRVSEDIISLYRIDLEKLAVVLQGYREIGLDIDITKELEAFNNAPDFISKCSAFLKQHLGVKRIYDRKIKYDNEKLTFHIDASYDKSFYCAAKLADKACDIQMNSEGTVYYVTFTGNQLEEIGLMYYDLVNAFNTERSDLVAAAEYLHEYDYFTYLQKTINMFISNLRKEYGYYSFVANSVLVSINKLIDRNRRKKLNKLYTAMAKENRVNTKWGTEYKLFVLVSKFVDDAFYQYRTEWLGQQSFDIFIPSQNIAIEYQGQQHYEALDVFGGQAAFEDNQIRDARKRKLSAEHCVKVLDWRYDISVNLENVRLFLEENRIDFAIPDDNMIVSETKDNVIEMAPVKVVEKPIKERTRPLSPFVIRQYEENGTFVKEYSSMTEASIECGVSEKSIKNVIYNVRKTGGGYVWKRCARGSEIATVLPVDYSENTGNAKGVLQISLEGHTIAAYDSIGQAAKAAGVNRRSISDVLSGAQKTAGGFYWAVNDRNA